MTVLSAVLLTPPNSPPAGSLTILILQTWELELRGGERSCLRSPTEPGFKLGQLRPVVDKRLTAPAQEPSG